ncbi:alpha/beta fold hydrolase [Microbulbifer sp. JMSA004]|uniref:alpha/beta fold hydrolase n=1 Tax=Microbulbifer sp. JMSA004 TaxID=3243370 RepID=UPI0026044EAC|nr:alpha/beta hydrolase [uncultured Microbulbifer sp.]
MFKYLLALHIALLPLMTSAQEREHLSVEVNGKNIGYVCKGTGELTILLVAGMGLNVQSTYKNTFRNIDPANYKVCMYDRAGYGMSTYGDPKVRTMSELADELTTLTEKLEWNKVVLVPHSFGGLVARAFTNQKPEVVKGIVFVDAAHESWYQDMKSSMSREGWKTMEWIMDWERNHHSFEDFEEASSHTSIYSIPSDLPITVMSRGIPHVSIRQTKMSYKDVDTYTKSWDRSQEKLRAITRNAEAVTMMYASHLFDESDPWIVIEHIEKMISKIENET